MDLPAYRTPSRVITASRLSEGAGFPVRRPFGEGETVPHVGGVFLMLDHMGPVSAMAGAPTHPHRGFETLSYVLSGSIRHRDSTGREGQLQPGGAQWMTAGRGVIHSEMPIPGQGKGTVFEGFQLWINLPAALKMCPSKYQDLRPEQLPIVSLAEPFHMASEDTDAAIETVTAGISSLTVLAEAGVAARSKSKGGTQAHAGVKVIAGSFRGATSPVTTQTAVSVLDVTLTAKMSVLTLPVPASHVCAVYVYRGAAMVGPERGKGGGKAVLVEESQCVTMADASAFAIDAPTTGTAEKETLLRIEASSSSTSTSSDSSSVSALVLHAAPIHDPVVRRGPFVLCTEKALRQAELDFAAGKLVPHQASAMAGSLASEAEDKGRDGGRKGRGAKGRDVEPEGQEMSSGAAAEDEQGQDAKRKGAGRGKR